MAGVGLRTEGPVWGLSGDPRSHPMFGRALLLFRHLAESTVLRVT